MAPNERQDKEAQTALFTTLISQFDVREVEGMPFTHEETGGTSPP